MSIGELILLQSDDSDIRVFNEKDDLYQSKSATQNFNHKMISHHIEFNAYRAKMVVDAQAQSMLARYKAESPDQITDFQDKAESIAYQLGKTEYTGIDTPSNPFAEPALATAWDNGYTKSTRIGKPKSQIDLEKKMWEQGIDTESQNSQFELAAITLYNLALRSNNDDVSARCKQLAFEMASYGDDCTPTTERQQQLNQFMALQTERLAHDIDF